MSSSGSVARAARSFVALASMAAASTGCVLILGYGDPVSVATDAAASVDAASEAGAGGSFCGSLPSKPTFCASFDGPSYLAEWDSQIADGVRLERDTQAAVSAPASLHVTVDDFSRDVAGNVSVAFRAFAGRTFTLHYAFDVRVDAAAPSGSYGILANPLIVASSGPPSFLLQLLARPKADGQTVALSVVEVMPETSQSKSYPSSQDIELGKWSRVDIVVVVASTATDGNRVTLTVDGTPAFDGPLTFPIGSGSPSLTLGISGVEAPATAWELHYDDAVVDIR